MKRLLLALAVFGAVALLVNESAAMRGGPGGGRGGAGARPPAGARSKSGTHPSPAQAGRGPTGNALGGIPHAPQVQGGKANAGLRPLNLEQFIRGGKQGTLPATATKNPEAISQVQSNGTNRRQAAYEWNSQQPEPFTPAWYKEHPNAWKETHPHADAVVAASAAGLARWLAVPVLPVAAASGGDFTAIVESSSQPAQPAVEDASLPKQDTGPEISDPVEWMPIGVFSLRASSETDATRVIHLAISQDGTLRGSQYDLVTDGVVNVQGRVDKESLTATWTIGKPGSVVFRAPLGELTKLEGKVEVRFSTGKTTQWQMLHVAQ